MKAYKIADDTLSPVARPGSVIARTVKLIRQMDKGNLEITTDSILRCAGNVGYGETLPFQQMRDILSRGVRRGWLSAQPHTRARSLHGIHCDLYKATAFYHDPENGQPVHVIKLRSCTAIALAAYESAESNGALWDGFDYTIAARADKETREAADNDRAKASAPGGTKHYGLLDWELFPLYERHGLHFHKVDETKRLDIPDTCIVQLAHHTQQKKHVVARINGRIVDTWNSTQGMWKVRGYFLPTKPAEAFKVDDMDAAPSKSHANTLITATGTTAPRLDMRLLVLDLLEKD